MLTKLRQLLSNKKGQGLVEYGILVGGVALVCLAATAVLGHKTNDLIATVAGTLPAAHAEDVGAIVSGQLVRTTGGGAGGAGISLDASQVGTLAQNLGINGADQLVLEAGDGTALPAAD